MELILAVLPGILLMGWFYLRDRYEKEPIRQLMTAFLLGALGIVPAVIIEISLVKWSGITARDTLPAVLFHAFVVAGLTEETVKYLLFRRFLFWKRDFNERYDGIIYAVYLSLGFATLENILYVLQGGITVALVRLLTAVPAHALFGTVMGYYLGKAKFASRGEEYHGNLLRALLIPVILHGAYNGMLMSGLSWLVLLFVPFMGWLWSQGLRHVRELIDSSPFRYLG